ncbi:MAG: glutamine-hydrolyzing GMP synthase [Bryobacteraceae bacterium]
MSRLADPQITVLDAGGQYCHLIARRVRELGVYADVMPSETPAASLAGRRGIIISGGPGSVYEPGSPTIDPATLALPSAVLGICYGQQLLAHVLDGEVRKGDRGEYGFAMLRIDCDCPLFENVDHVQRVWMSHRDVVGRPPTGYSVLAHTDTCAVAAIGDTAQRRYGVQFHPEVVHTPAGKTVLSNFLFRVCGCEKDWDPRGQIARLEAEIRQAADHRKVFFFVSGGVDSAVAYQLCLRALGAGRVHGAYVDTGLMRQGETESVRRAFPSIRVEDAAERFLRALDGVVDPEDKRRAIGEQFVAVQEQVLQSGHYLEGNWILGQGTIYPDTIESGGTAKADLIKTHHNRVAGIQRLIEDKRLLEPLAAFYKDEVRELGRELGLPEEIVGRHPFPGPGLAIRCLCSTAGAALEPGGDGWVVPVRSVGVQGDSRSYRAVLALERFPEEALLDTATRLTNDRTDINRVIATAGSHIPLPAMCVTPGGLNAERLGRLRAADAIVRRMSVESGFEKRAWQFPVILIPLGGAARPDSVVLRPIDSADGMTAESVIMDRALLEKMTAALLSLDGVCGVFYDLTHKPPGTIEWE